MVPPIAAANAPLHGVERCSVRPSAWCRALQGFKSGDIYCFCLGFWSMTHNQTHLWGWLLPGCSGLAQCAFGVLGMLGLLISLADHSDCLQQGCVFHRLPMEPPACIEFCSRPFPAWCQALRRVASSGMGGVARGGFRSCSYEFHFSSFGPTVVQDGHLHDGPKRFPVLEKPCQDNLPGSSAVTQ